MSSPARGVAADLSHISTKAKVTGYLPADDGLKAAFTGADVIVIPAGIPRKPGMTHNDLDLFNINAGIIRDLIIGIALYAPSAFILVISNPVNSTVPIAAEVLKKHGVFDPKKLFGVTTLDVVRSETFTASVVGKSDPSVFKVPVIGGHSGDTIVPLLSLSEPKVELSDSDRAALVHRIQFGGDEVVQAKEGKGSATLSMAHAGFHFAGIVENTFVYLSGVPGGGAVKDIVAGLDYFSVPIELGCPSGAVKAMNILPQVSEYENGLLEVAYTGLAANIKKGVDFIVGAPEAK
ncbi:lactate/malate dehydrogenase [Lipomyces kononenkoae]|uniref:Lactate/malate dehydrogenase n=1 Tax=Lipomyces kononenkoae TaxID=34357 RepID=A0ACC3T237_LIPKO